jgi:hypothetical protein
LSSCKSLQLQYLPVIPTVPLRAATSFVMACESEALVARGPFSEGKWALEPVKLRELRDDEVLVHMVASGICHTDLHCGDTAADAGVPGVFYPRVLGHEGDVHI